MAYAFNNDKSKNTLANVATSGSYNDLTDKPDLKAVATSGSYNDLSNKPDLANILKTNNIIKIFEFDIIYDGENRGGSFVKDITEFIPASEIDNWIIISFDHMLKRDPYKQTGQTEWSSSIWIDFNIKEATVTTSLKNGIDSIAITDNKTRLRGTYTIPYGAQTMDVIRFRACLLNINFVRKYILSGGPIDN